MKLDFARDQWYCVGFDGEGCPIELTMEDVDPLPDSARHISVTPTGRLKWR